MREYSVEIPMSGRIYVTVEANSKQEAIEKALEECDLTLKQSSEKGYELEEWGVHDFLMRGNVFYGVCHSADAVES